MSSLAGILLLSFASKKVKKINFADPAGSAIWAPSILKISFSGGFADPAGSANPPPSKSFSF